MAILVPDSTTTLNSGLTINEYLLINHNPNKIAIPAKRTASQPLIGVTLHNTNWIDAAPGSTPAEQYVRATCNGNMGDSRVHYYVDDKCAWRDLGDEYTSWHSATGGQGQGNSNTISIESIMRSQTDAASVASMENAAKLVAWIFGKYGWTVEKNLYTHNYWTNYKATGQLSKDLDAQSLKKVPSTTKCFNDASTSANPSGKYCPAFILPQWDAFKGFVKKHMGGSSISDEDAIWRFLEGKGLNAFAVAGIMGNMQAESGLKPDNLQNSFESRLGMSDAQYTAAVDSGSYRNFASDSAGYGLVQWTYGARKQALLDYAKSVGASIGSLQMQLDFFWKELQGYTGVISALKSAKSVLDASNAILLQYERPADQSVAVQSKRAGYGQAYYDKYAVSDSSSQLYQVTASSSLNCRSGAGTAFSIVGAFKSKEIVLSSKGSYSGAWLYVSNGKLEGWASTDFLAPLTVEGALSKLVKEGVVSSPDYWMENCGKINYLDRLIISIGYADKKAGDSGNTIKTAEAAIDRMAAKGLISSPDYWRLNYKNLEWLDSLLIKAANKLA
jgi:hypothetical protein